MPEYEFVAGEGCDVEPADALRVRDEIDLDDLASSS
jgi:hypothetical protein